MFLPIESERKLWRRIETVRLTAGLSTQKTQIISHLKIYLRHYGFAIAVQSRSHIWFFATPWIAARQASLSFTSSQSLLKYKSIESVLPSKHRVLQTVKNLPAMQEAQVQSLGWEDPLEKQMATHSSILAGEAHGQRSLLGRGWQGVRHDWVTGTIAYFPKMTFLNIWTNKKAKNMFFKHIFLDLLKIRCLNVK